MKTLVPFLVIAAAGVFPFAARAAEPAPAVPIEQAVKLAQEYLKKSGAAGGRYIESVKLGRASLAGERVWEVEWSSPIRGEVTEAGVQIDMRGGLVKVVRAGAVPGVGQQRVGARNIR
jgi:hypothetical protein